MFRETFKEKEVENIRPIHMGKVPVRKAPAIGNI